MDEITLLRLDKHLEDVKTELLRATKKFSPFHSGHEGYAVIKEELEELWEEIKKKKLSRDLPTMRREAVQVAAMALRFLTDIEG